MQLLLEKDVIGRDMLYAACMVGQSEVIRALAKYGVDMKDKTPREAKQTLQMFISHVQATITDPEKVQGRLNKEDKNASLSACRAKSDWLNSTKEATRLDFLAQKQELEDKMLPIFTKMATPRLPTAKNVKSSFGGGGQEDDLDEYKNVHMQITKAVRCFTGVSVIPCLLSGIAVEQWLSTTGTYTPGVLEKALKGYTLLHCTAAWGQLETLKILVELGADIVATTFRGEKARDIACRYGQAECVDFLDWSEAKQALQIFISHIQATISSREGAGKAEQGRQVMMTVICSSPVTGMHGGLAMHKD
ncbi:ankyrin repeat domain-containing protein 45 isoform A [Alligator mississippiensis]|uniref:Ankyrin repeat domain-containing protein 45 isoform A n=1 Tax=Alligator mississippiensis TaxID=8496 RepID=A0A151MIH6_ALLMI|nr:ankyrin repeat domain-containing protein 45 isoform A [Alligator mississippiensis]